MSAAPPPASYENGVLLFTAPSIGPDTDDRVVTIRVRVREGYDQLRNYALVTADGVTPTHAALLTNVYTQAVHLSLLKTAYAAVVVGDELVYTLRVENDGEAVLPEVRVWDVMPAGLALEGASPWPDQVSLPILQWSLGSLAPAEVWEAVLTTTAPAQPTVLTNTAFADSRITAVTDTLFATEVVTGAILRVTKEGSVSRVSMGDELVYTIHYWNGGSRDAGDVVLTDTLPADVTVVGVSPAATTATTDYLVWELGALPVGASGTLVVTTTVNWGSGDVLHNEVDVVAADSFPGHAEVDTIVGGARYYLPLVMRNY